ncbi:SRPBCC domain-containing protein [Rhizobium grahamii]|uniref:SRPBCC domain-containing protein n=1 Tax=Rhizobium grahamii TaxID=1120045 RepID=A0A5Q0C5X2_9HYPH|nr:MULTISPECIES: SRPBCC domain-containing protein [Rhizobium]QFY59684.1 SRPBCC domain-containing protein [Rhizobium grahamii]QRM51203.1 SRPBCC domain-containing protein [Rhizobium sp. BG6]
MSACNTITLNVEHTYAASPCAVYDAWLNPERAKRFMFATDSGRVIRADIDARVGGHFLVIDRRPTGDAVHYGVFLELRRPRRMVFCFSVAEHDHNADRIQIDIEPLGEGTRLTLSHEMCAEWGHFEEETRQGWAHVLEGLERELDGVVPLMPALAAQATAAPSKASAP